MQTCVSKMHSGRKTKINWPCREWGGVMPQAMPDEGPKHLRRRVNLTTQRLQNG